MQLNFEKDGVAIREGVLTCSDIGFIASNISLESEILRRGGIRNLEKKFASIAKLASNNSVLQLAKTCLDGTPRLVRALWRVFVTCSRRVQYWIGWSPSGCMWTLRMRAAAV